MVKRILSIKEAGERLGISEHLAGRAMKAGQLPYVTLGKRKVVPVAALNQWLKGGGYVPEIDLQAGDSC